MNVQRLFTIFCLTFLLVLTGCGGNPSDSGDNDNDPPSDDPPTEDTTPPSSPGGLDGSSGDETVELTWNANSEDDLDGYNVYRSEESFSDVSEMDLVNGSSLITSEEYTDDEVNNGTTYYYRLTAVDDSENESSTSSEVEVTPFADPPDRPKN